MKFSAQERREQVFDYFAQGRCTHRDLPTNERKEIQNEENFSFLALKKLRGRRAQNRKIHFNSSTDERIVPRFFLDSGGRPQRWDSHKRWKLRRRRLLVLMMFNKFSLTLNSISFGGIFSCVYPSLSQI